MTRGVMGRPNGSKEQKSPGAVLLEITNAYPRVNKPLLKKTVLRLGTPAETLRVLKCLHEYTAYRVKGREGLSDPWHPAKGARDGYATSPLLFNIYHAEAMRAAQEKRKQAVHAMGRE